MRVAAGIGMKWIETLYMPSNESRALQLLISALSAETMTISKRRLLLIHNKQALLASPILVSFAFVSYNFPFGSSMLRPQYL